MEPTTTAQLVKLGVSVLGGMLGRNKPQMTPAQARALLASPQSKSLGAFARQALQMTAARAPSPPKMQRAASSTTMMGVSPTVPVAALTSGAEPMSLLGTGNGFGSDLLGTIGNIASNYFTAKFSNASIAPAGIAPLGPLVGGAMRALPAVVGAAGGMVARSAGSIMRGAATWCRKNPAWCAQVGGTAAIAGMIQDGRLPMPKRRRGRGISSRDLRSFRRVNNLLSAVCKTPVPRGPRRKSC